MAAGFLPDNPELSPFVLCNVTPTGTRIGAGSFGSVEEVAISGTICAAKKIHDIFEDRSEILEAEIRRVSTQFVKECQLMSTLRHPHIVQFLGVCFFEGSRLPALVMERLLTNLHDLLDPEVNSSTPTDSQKPFFPLSLKCSILHNVASGLVFLHEQTPPIIHRDLSARNVLLTSGMVAKIADLGVARIVPRMKAAATMTKAPGAGIYMPPEATFSEDNESSTYGVTIDVFSFGVVAIFALSQTFPCNLMAPTYRDERRRIVGRSELERRDEYMQMIYSQLREEHPLLQMIERCLDFPEDRPNGRDVLNLLEQARDEERDDQMEMNKLELIQALYTQHSNKSHVQEVCSEKEQQTLRLQLTRKDAELSKAQETVRRQQQQIEEMRQREQYNEREIWDLKRQLQSSEALVADFLKTFQQRDPELESKVLSHKSTQNPVETNSVPTELDTSSTSQSTRQSSLHAAGPVAVPHSIPPSKQGKLTVQCCKKKSAPCEMLRGSATTNDHFAFFAPGSSESVYKYEWSTEKWEEIPSSPYRDSRLVIVNCALTAVGGEDKSRYTNKLFTLQQDRWVEHYPPMNTERSSPAVVSTADGSCVLVIGGRGGFDNWTATVELFHVRSRRWFELTSLPQALSFPSATICGNLLHVIGRDGSGHSCSIQALASSDQPNILTWTQLPKQPVRWSTASTLWGQLVTVGGEHSWSQVSSIYQLVNGVWVKIGSMSCGRRRCLVVSPTPDKMIIVGGRGGGDSVEECSVV